MLCCAVQGVLAYVILRPATSVVGFIAALFGKYGDAMLRFDRAYVYIVLVNNVSQVGWPSGPARHWQILPPSSDVHSNVRVGCSTISHHIPISCISVISKGAATSAGMVGLGRCHVQLKIGATRRLTSVRPRQPSACCSGAYPVPAFPDAPHRPVWPCAQSRCELALRLSAASLSPIGRP